MTEGVKRDVINVEGNSQALGIIRSALYEFEQRGVVKTMDKAEYILWRLIRSGNVTQRT